MLTICRHRTRKRETSLLSSRDMRDRRDPWAAYLKQTKRDLIRFYST